MVIYTKLNNPQQCALNYIKENLVTHVRAISHARACISQWRIPGLLYYLDQFSDVGYACACKYVFILLHHFDFSRIRIKLDFNNTMPYYLTLYFLCICFQARIFDIKYHLTKHIYEVLVKIIFIPYWTSFLLEIRKVCTHVETSLGGFSNNCEDANF